MATSRTSMTNVLPHPFSLDDLDDQSRLINSEQARVKKLVRNVVKVENPASQWFERLVLKRKRNAVLAYAAVSAVLFLASVVLLQISLIHPIRSVMHAFFIIVSSSTYLLLIFYIAIDAFFLFIVSVFLLKFDVERRLSIWNHISWLVFLMFVFVDIIRKCILILAAIGFQAGMNNKTHLFIFVTTSCTVAFWITFRFNYQLVFPAVELSPRYHIQAAFHSERIKFFKIVFPVFKWALITSFLFGLPIFGWSFIGSFLDVRLYGSWILLIFLQFFSHYFGVSVIKGFVLQHYTFELPAPYANAWQTSGIIPDLAVALESNSNLLKAFAFWDLRNLAIKNRDRRAVIYSLSQPGGHPRNWTVVKNACLKLLNSIKVQVEYEISQIQQEAHANLQVANDDGDVNKKGGPTILLAKQLCHDKNLRRRILHSEVRQSRTENLNVFNFWTIVMNKFFRSSRNVFSGYEGNLAVLCIESLGMLIWHSYDEDGYGVVQKDLRSIMSLLLQLIVVLDRYIRHNKQTAEEAVLHNLGIVNILYSSIGSSITRISSKFGTSLNSIGLNTLEMDVLEKVTGLSRGFE